MRSIVEGVTYAMRDSIEIIRGLGVPVQVVRASGGGAKSQFWRQMQADMYQANVVTINASEGPAFGVAILAAVGTGLYKSVPEACQAMIKVETSIKPNSKNARKYAEYYPEFGRLYQALKPRFVDISLRDT